MHAMGGLCNVMQVDHRMTWVARSLDLDSVIVNVDQNDPFDVARITSCCVCAVSCKCVLLHLLMLFKDHELLKINNMLQASDTNLSSARRI